MNLAQTFTPARAVAQHCEELTRRGPRPEERAQLLASWRRDVARNVASDLVDLLSGTKLEAQISEPETLTGKAVFERIGMVAANSLLRCGGDDRCALLSFDIATAIALTDRSFGGTGEVATGEDADIGTGLPRSAGLLVEQAARAIAKAITRASAGGDAADRSANGNAMADVIVRSESAARLKPFTPACECVFFKLNFGGDDGIRWVASLAMPAERLNGLLPGLGSPGGPRPRSSQAAQASDAAFGAIPLPLEAVLAEFDLPLARLERLAPGDCIALSVARDIPLRIGAQTVARGSLGTMEDRMALRLTDVCATPVFFEGKPA